MYIWEPGGAVEISALPEGIREFGEALTALTDHITDGDHSSAAHVRAELLDLLNWIYQMLARLDAVERGRR